MQRGLGEAAPPKGVPPMSDCRGFPHERLHQEIVTIFTRQDYSICYQWMHPVIMTTFSSLRQEGKFCFGATFVLILLLFSASRANASNRQKLALKSV
ncbi:MAG: hypothetical protein F6J98_22950 [Moorea sp. SIO4G2]|nr:hypothetical protein [Moorena sp. SIO4G2]